MTDIRGGEITVIVDIVCSAWREVGPDLEEVVRAAARTAAVEAGVALPAVAELGVRLCDDAEILVLNRSWRDRDAATNVLAFALNDTVAPGDLMLGDVVVAYETCAAEAKAQQKTLSDHLSHMVVHGTLHLLGFDHQDDDQAEAMEDLERTVLTRLGVADPYLGDEAA
ncbi:MAG: rRNA maturation RNase YbeY [Alphaproteobacteria bacterium]|nr:rRNA maturation RNase YbeY [Alphaproteobacteria bacterium]HCP00110.1 rRNA maturation RNase YbeY [Rhodospirillaceae bacterium]